MKAFITGINGQDGSYLTELLLSCGYEVHGMVRRHSVSESQTARLEHLRSNENLHFHYGDVADSLCVSSLIAKIKPDEIYHLAAMSHVMVSFEMPRYTAEINALGTLHILEAVKTHCPNAKIYNASTSELFGNSIDSDGFQRETTPMLPVSPYGFSKLYAHHMCNYYRNTFGMFICSGILGNHESPRRGKSFVTAKVVSGAVNIKKGKQKYISLGNLDPRRDWGHAKDYVKAMHMLLQQNSPQDLVIASGISHSVQELVDYVFNKLGLDSKLYIKQDAKQIRPQEVWNLRCDASFAKKELGWFPVYTFETLIDEMIEYYLNVGS